MRQLTSIIILIFTAFFAFTPYSGHARQINLPQVHILADPSLTIPLTLIARNFSQQQHVAVMTSFASTRKQAEQIEAGGEADVFITTHKGTLDHLKNQGLIDVYSQTELVGNRLYLATYRDNPLELVLIPRLPLVSILERLDPDFSFALSDPAFQATGVFSVEAIHNYDLASELESHFLFIRSLVDMHKTIAEPGGYGIMLRTEVLRNSAIKMLSQLPSNSHSPITYQAAVVAGEHMDQARTFVEFLRTPESLKVFTDHGFELLDAFKTDKGHLARGSTVKSSNNPS